MGNNKMVRVTNRSGATVVYAVPEMHVRRQFAIHETKMVPFEELQALSYQQGGLELIYHFLLVEEVDSLRELINAEEEPEYWLTEKQIPEWLNTCTLGEFTDALNFAPEGVKELIKQYSVSVPLNDYNKRKKVLEILDFDVDAAVKNDEADKADDPKKEAPVRINAPVPGKPGRQSNPTYRIVKPANTETKE